MTRECEVCRQPYESRSKTSKFCARPDCVRRRARERKRSSRQGEPAGVVVEFQRVDPPAPVAGELSVYAATFAALADADRAMTPAGTNALRLAARLDDSHMDTGSGVAAASKQHLAALGEALKGVSMAGDLVDELESRRAKRLGFGA